MQNKKTGQKNTTGNDKEKAKAGTSSSSSGLGPLVMISQLGLTTVTPIVLGAVAGHWLDGKFGTGMIFFLILLCLGIAGGFISAYRQIMTVVKPKKKI